MEVLFKPSVLWFFVSLIFFVGELFNAGFIIFFFGIGALFVSIASLVFDLSINVQFGIFIIVSTASLFFFRSRITSAFKGDKEENKESFDDLIGEKAVVVKKIVPGLGGKVFFRGSNWEADSKFEIDKDEPVKIVEKNSIKLIVEPFEEKEI